MGKDKTKFYVHIDVVSARSKFFKSAFSQAWGIDKKTIDLSDSHPRTFSNYRKVLYQGEMPLETKNYDTYLRLIRIYSLADKLADLKSVNLVIDAIIARSDRTKTCPAYSLCTNAITRLILRTPH